MEKEIEIPDGVEVGIDGIDVTVKGPKGEISRDFTDPRFIGMITIEKGDNLVVKASLEKRKLKAMVGTIASHIKNMMDGVNHGFEYKMKIVYTHFPMTVKTEENTTVVNNFLGEKGVRRSRIMGDAKVDATKESVIVTGINLEDVSQTAANIEKSCGIGRRDRRVFQDGIYLEKKGVQKGE